MSITIELRNYAVNEFGPYDSIIAKDRFNMLREIADRIDAAHEKKLSECKTECIAQGVLNGIEYVGVIPDSELAKLGLIRLPVDSDGEPIHIGDMMSVNFTSCSKETHGKVLKLELSSAEVDNPVWVNIANSGSWTPEHLHHYKLTPAERIRKLAEDALTAITDSDRIDLNDALREIADELEGEGE